MSSEDKHLTGPVEDLNDNNRPRSYSSLSEDDSRSNNFTSQMYRSTPDRLPSTSALGFCTGERRRIHPNDSSEKPKRFIDFRDSLSDSFGLSKNLSSDSLRWACGYIDDDVSDNDLIEVHHTPDKFQSRESSQYRCLGDGHFFTKRKNSEESPLYIIEYSSNELINSQPDAAFSALQDLDAVLDVHEASLLESVCSASQTEYDSERTNIEDCLLDLDDYLDKMDNSIFQDCNSATNLCCCSNIVSDNNKLAFQRGHNLRSTLGCTSDKRQMYSGEQLNGTSNLNLVYGTLGSGRIRIPNEKVVISGKAENIDGSFTETAGNHAVLRKYDDQLRNSDVRRSLSHGYCSDRNNATGIQALTEEQIFKNLIEQQMRHRPDGESRPRQYGRRAERNSRVSMPNGDNAQLTQCINTRPRSAPALVPLSLLDQQSCIPVCNASDGSIGRSSRNASPVTIVSSSDSSDSSTTSHTIVESSLVIDEECPQPCTSASADLRHETETLQKTGFNTYWPHNYSRTLALISCTLGLFNTCRFAVVAINYGANFLIQFLLLSLIFGIPFLWLQMCLGAKIRAGPVSMWKISPICSGVGISLVFVQYLIAIYSSVVVVWLLVYIGDTFMFQSTYRWADTPHSLIPRNYSQTYNNITESIPDYFNINVLQRLQILQQVDNKSVRVHISDRLAFYLAILWATVFLILCKGLKSFGKVLFIIGILPLLTMTVIVGKLLCIVDLKRLQNMFSPSELDDFLINSKTWIAAAQETFFTWGILGASVIAVSSRTFKSQSKLTLRRDAVLVVLITLFGLCLSALMGLCCIQILNQSDYVYVPGSYEKPGYYSAVYSLKSSANSDIISFPAKFVPHYSSLIGEVYRRHADVKHISGYQVLRFVTELFPAVVTIAGESISWIWVAVVIFMLFMLGVAQLCVMWKPISSALGNSTSSVLLSCVTGLLLSIPFATEVGITLLHYIDTVIGGAWFIPILWAAEIFGVFLIRGRPYNGDDLVNDLKMSGSMSAFLALSWNVLLPISLIALAVIEYKVSLSSQLYYWRGRSYYAYWARKMGALTQIGFLLVVPITAIVQIYRYLISGPPDILDRIQMLYRPMEGLSSDRALNRINREGFDVRYRPGSSRAHLDFGISTLQDDAPPKYTPPPSYTTATGVRLAKILRQSIRRSVRRLLGDSGRSRPILSIQIEQDVEHSTFPPDYSSVLSNPSGAFNEITPSISESIEITNRPNSHAYFSRSLSLGRKTVLQKKRRLDNHSNSYRPFSAPREINRDSNSTSHSNRTVRPYTAEDVITILRSSTRDRNGTSHLTHPQTPILFRSIENLVLNAEPPGISSTIMPENLTENDQNNTSVI